QIFFFMLSSIVKWLLDSVARQSSRSSIEIIVFYLIIASFIYGSLFRSPTEFDFFKVREIDFVQVISYPNTNEFVILSNPDLISQASRIRLNQVIVKTQLEEPIILIFPHQPTIVQKSLESFARFQELVEKRIYISDWTDKLYYNVDGPYSAYADTWLMNFRTTFHTDFSASEITKTYTYENSTALPILDVIFSHQSSPKASLYLIVDVASSKIFRV
ncbi:7723_t:CDS:1, partial [Racocetra persica]